MSNSPPNGGFEVWPCTNGHVHIRVVDVENGRVLAEGTLMPSYAMMLSGALRTAAVEASPNAGDDGIEALKSIPASEMN